MEGMEKGRIVSGGMGGFLNPPGHPEHTHHVQTDLRRRPENRGGTSLEAAAKASWLDPATRHAAKRMLDAWKESRPANPPKAWVKEVLAYFKGSYKKPGGGWNVSDLTFDDRDSIRHQREHAGIHFIRKFYPDYMPLPEDFPERKSVGGITLSPRRGKPGFFRKVVKKVSKVFSGSPKRKTFTEVVIEDARRRAREEGRKGFPKHVADLAEDIANVVMHDGHKMLPYQLATRFGLTGSQAAVILSASASAYGPGGRGHAWMIRKTAKVIQGKA
jgi:hypothetical protein